MAAEPWNQIAVRGECCVSYIILERIGRRADARNGFKGFADEDIGLEGPPHSLGAWIFPRLLFTIRSSAASGSPTAFLDLLLTSHFVCTYSLSGRR
jgi:hypothetical protein